MAGELRLPVAGVSVATGYGDFIKKMKQLYDFLNDTIALYTTGPTVERERVLKDRQFVVRRRAELIICAGIAGLDEEAQRDRNDPTYTPATHVTVLLVPAMDAYLIKTSSTSHGGVFPDALIDEPVPVSVNASGLVKATFTNTQLVNNVVAELQAILAIVATEP